MGFNKKKYVIKKGSHQYERFDKQLREWGKKLSGTTTLGTSYPHGWLGWHRRQGGFFDMVFIMYTGVEAYMTPPGMGIGSAVGGQIIKPIFMAVTLDGRHLRIPVEDVRRVDMLRLEEENENV